MSTGPKLAKESSIVNDILVDAGQHAFIRAAIKHFEKEKKNDKGQVIVGRTELKKFAASKEAGFNLACAPSYIVKNTQFKVKNEKGELIRGQYNLSIVDSWNDLDLANAAVKKRKAPAKMPTLVLTPSVPKKTATKKRATLKKKAKEKDHPEKPIDPLPEIEDESTEEDESFSVVLPDDIQ